MRPRLVRCVAKAGSRHCISSSSSSNAEEHVSGLAALLGSANVKSSPADDLSAFTSDWTRHFVLSPQASRRQIVALPSTTAEVSAVIKYANAKQLAVIPQGGNTGLVGGGVGVDPAALDQKRFSAEVILSLSRMNKILEVDEESALIVCEAGCVLQALNTSLHERGLEMPIDLGSKGQCQIGGNLATNAGGLNVIRHGPLGAHVLGLEVVTGDGQVLDMMRRHRKDNMGLHTPQLFVGSEGALGVITKAVVALVPVPRHRQVLLVKLRAFDGPVGKSLSLAKTILGETLGAFEFMDSRSIASVQRALPALLPTHLSPLFPKVEPCTHADADADAGIEGEILLLVECSSASSDLGPQLSEYVAALSEHDLLAEGGANSAVVSQSPLQHAQLWKIRENVPVALARLAAAGGGEGGGKLYKHDVSLPLSGPGGMASAVAQVKRQLRKEGFRLLDASDQAAERSGRLLQIACFGHAGDGNLHLNILVECAGREDGSGGTDSTATKTKNAIDRAVLKAVTARRGSMSAEHGVGQKLRAYVPLVRSREELQLAAGIKRLLDPQGVLQPGKFLPPGF